MPYLGRSPGSGVRSRFIYAATSGQTSFSGNDSNSVSLAYEDTLYMDVYQNGVLLKPVTDYAATTGTSVVLTTGATTDDVVEMIVYDTFAVADTVSASNGGTFAGAIGFSGGATFPDSAELVFGADSDFKISHNGSKTKLEDTGTGNLEIRGTNIEFYSGDGGETLAKLTDDGAAELYHNNTKRIETSSTGVDITGAFTATDGCTITTADNSQQLSLISTDADANVGPELHLRRNSASPANSDAAGEISFNANNNAGQDTQIADIFTNIHNVADGSEEGGLEIRTMKAGTMRSRINMYGSTTVFNDASQDIDFRVETSGNANAFVAQGSDGFIGMGVAAPRKALHILQAGSDGVIILDANNNSTDHQICFAHSYGAGSETGGKYYAIGNDDSESTLVIAFDANSQASLSADKIIEIHGAAKCVGINSTPTDQTLKIGNAASSQTIQMLPSNGSLAAPILQTEATRGQSDVFDHIKMSNNNGGDLEFKVRGDGQVTADGAFSGGGADYAEYFEWTDGNSSSEDRRGYSVVLDGNKVRKATSDDAATLIIGIVSARPVVVGDTAWNHWIGRWERDDYGDVVKEAYTVTTWDAQGADSNGVAGEGPKVHHSYHTDRIPDGLTAPSDAVVTSKELDGTTNLMRPKEASNYDASQAYVPRENRVEWDAIGLMGKLRMKKGQPTGDRWIKLRDISSDVEEWLVR